MTARPKCQLCNVDLKANDPIVEVGLLQWADRRRYHTRCYSTVVMRENPNDPGAKIIQALSEMDDPRQIDLEECIRAANKA